MTKEKKKVDLKELGIKAAGTVCTLAGDILIGCGISTGLSKVGFKRHRTYHGGNHAAHHYNVK